MKKIVGFMGFKGSGKDTAAQALLNIDQEWDQRAFADPLKRALCDIFGWEWEMILGHSAESRAWREQVEPWWAERLGIPHFTPRWAMTTIGTDVLRKHFNDSIWIHAMDRQIEQCPVNVVITDCRYHNEAALIKRHGGILIYISKGTEPDYYKYSSRKPDEIGYEDCQEMMMTKYAHIHDSEWAWNNIEFDTVIVNDSTITALHSKVYKALGYGS